MIREIKGYPILEGVRGEKGKDIDAGQDYQSGGGYGMRGDTA